MRENDWYPLVADALVRSLDLDPVLLHAQVQFRDGSIADFVYIAPNRVVVFEVKVAEVTELAAPLDGRALRQLRHFTDAADEVYVVTLGVPTTYAWTPDGLVLPRPTFEPQLAPPHVGWIAYDSFGRTVSTLRPAARNPSVRPDDRRQLVETVTARLARARRAVESCRV